MALTRGSGKGIQVIVGTDYNDRDLKRLERDLKRAMSRRILFRREGKLLETNAHSAAELKARLGQTDLAAKLRAEVILNLLPFADASAIYRKGV